MDQPPLPLSQSKLVGPKSYFKASGSTLLYSVSVSLPHLVTVLAVNFIGLGFSKSNLK